MRQRLGLPWRCQPANSRHEIPHRRATDLLLWSAEKLTRPTFTNLTESYEGWAYRNGLFRQTSILEKRHFIERDPATGDDRIYRLTWKGRLHVLGGRDPQKCWTREWDGRWRMVLFDVPNSRNTERARLRRYLQSKGFGWLQNSVWVKPDPLEEERQILRDGKVDVGSLLLLEARPCAGESDAEIVSCAWNFDRVNRNYAALMRILEERPTGALKDETRARTLQRWATAEREAWLEAVTIDPLLPEQLLPPGYLGKKAWNRRVEVLREAGRQLRTFSPGKA